MLKVEISIGDLETGIVGQTDYRLDLKFYSPNLRTSYLNFLGGKYPTKYVDDVADVIETSVQIDEGKEYQYLQIGDIDGNLGEIMSTTTIVGADLPSRAQLELSKGDILVSSVRPLLREIAIIPEELDGEIGTNGFIALRCTGVNSRYLFYVLRTNYVTNELDRRASALNYPAISEHDLKFLQIPVPTDPNIQSELANAFDNATSEIKGIKKKVESLTEERDQVLRSFLRKKIQPSVEPHIKYALDEVERNEVRIDLKYYRYSRKHPYQHLSLEIISNLGTFRTSEINPRDSPDDEFIQVTASRYKGIIYRDRKLGSEILTKTQTPIETADIVISRIDLYNGCLGQVSEELNGAIVTRDFMVFTPFMDKIEPMYLIEVLKDDYMADYFYAFAVGCTGRKRITLDTFKQLKVPVWDRNTEQKPIVAKIKEKESTIQVLTEQAQKIYESAEKKFLESLGVERAAAPQKLTADESTHPS